MLSYFTRLKYAFRTFFSILDRHCIPDDVLAALVPIAPAAASSQPPADDGARAAQMLSLLQRDGRLVDFLMEDVAPYDDAQIGAAVRDVHAGCRQVLQRYVTLAPVLETQEGGTVTIQAGTDPAMIKVIGNAGHPPFSGLLRHRGWIASRVDLPPIPPTGRFVIAPAEVEVP
jgi:Domain of unknown function (DUF2760)